MNKDELTPQEEAVKNYLEKQAAEDEALRALYVPARIKDCFAYITGQARKKAVNGCAMIEDAQVYKWARDYYIEELPKKAEKQDVATVQQKPKEEKETKTPHIWTNMCFDF